MLAQLLRETGMGVLVGIGDDVSFGDAVGVIMGMRDDADARDDVDVGVGAARQPTTISRGSAARAIDTQLMRNIDIDMFPPVETAQYCNVGLVQRLGAVSQKDLVPADCPSGPGLYTWHQIIISGGQCRPGNP
jgi:hypothetical protein